MVFGKGLGSWERQASQVEWPHERTRGMDETAS